MVSALAFSPMAMVLTGMNNSVQLIRADVEAKGTLTICGMISGEYTIYQVFTGQWSLPEGENLTVADDANPITNVKGMYLAFGAGFDADAVKTELKTELNNMAGADDTKIPDTDALAYDYALLMNQLISKDVTTAHKVGNLVAKIAKKHNIAGTDVTIGEDQTLTTELNEGYYLIATKTDNIQEMTGTLTPVVQGQTTELMSKSSGPFFKKTLVGRVTDGKGVSKNFTYADGKWEDRTYNLMVNLPTNYIDRDDYQIEVVDKLPTGMTVDETTLKNDWNLKIVYLDEMNDFSLVTCADVFDVSVVNGNEIHFTSNANFVTKFKALHISNPSIQIQYTPPLATVMDGKTFDTVDDMITNTAYMKYTNRVYDQTVTDKVSTPTQTASIMTYVAEIKVVDYKGDPMTGADFEIVDRNGKQVGKILTNANGVLQVAGLDLNTQYTIKNTNPVSGFKAKDDVTFTLTKVANEGKDYPQITVNISEKKDNTYENSDMLKDTAGNTRDTERGTGVTVTYMFDKTANAVIMPGTGVTVGAITIVAGMVALGAGSAILLKKED